MQVDREGALIDPGGGRELAPGGARHTPTGKRGPTPRGEIELPRARLLVRGPVDLAVLERVLASLSR